MIPDVVPVDYLFHGKTSPMNCRIKMTRLDIYTKDLRHTDFLLLSIKSTSVSFMFQNMCEKVYLLNIFDIPGYVNSTAFPVFGGIYLVIGTREGLLLRTKRLLKYGLQERLPDTLRISKADYFILESKTPP
ncbi:hypothetical protein FGIG_06447 [Fasciola gigantica]|uniref:Uncharacterized protein n=1 Tax=Fasciola gigantica TaxID=46835 RepID=A0A504Z1N9_FASGI|nr:hypothetical protein FGIG_06447 [Fasciola gigantica]